MNVKIAKEIKKLHKDGKCQECFEGECMDEPLGFLTCHEKYKSLVEALKSYASCGDGCTCGDGWGHGDAKDALEHYRKEILGEEKGIKDK